MPKSAALPVPSAKPATPHCPAIVLTSPSGVILRIVVMPNGPSATYTVPSVSTATLFGQPKRARSPCPSRLPLPPNRPASKASAGDSQLTATLVTLALPMCPEELLMLHSSVGNDVGCDCTVTE